MSLTIKDIMTAAYQNAKEKGFYDGAGKTVAEDIALMHSELSEALEEYRNNHPVNESRIENGKLEGVPAEMSDVIIRICEFAEFHKIDLETAITQKMAYNKTRPYKHGNKKI